MTFIRRGLVWAITIPCFLFTTPIQSSNDQENSPFEAFGTPIQSSNTLENSLIEAFHPHAKSARKFAKSVLGEAPPISTKQNPATPDARDTCLHETRTVLGSVFEESGREKGLSASWRYIISGAISRFGLGAEWHTFSTFSLLFSDATHKFDIYTVLCQRPILRSDDYDPKYEASPVIAVFPKGQRVCFGLNSFIHQDQLSVLAGSIIYDPMVDELYPAEELWEEGTSRRALHDYLAQAPEMSLEIHMLLPELSPEEIAGRIAMYNAQVDKWLMAFSNGYEYYRCRDIATWELNGFAEFAALLRSRMLTSYERMLRMSQYKLRIFKPHIKMGEDGTIQAVRRPDGYTQGES